MHQLTRATSTEPARTKNDKKKEIVILQIAFTIVERL